MADKTIGELPNLPAISPLDLLVAQHNEEATKVSGATLTNFFKDYIGPVAATSASQMTNTNKVYIYIGNESGYTNGNWYYYNGSTWVSGGAYNSQAVNTDATLTHEGVPADAEAAGKIVEISETQPAAPANRIWIPETQEATVEIPTMGDINDIVIAGNRVLEVIKDSYYDATTGEPTDWNGWDRTDLIYIGDCAEVEIYLSTQSDYVVLFDNSKQYLRSMHVNAGRDTYDTSGACYIGLSSSSAVMSTCEVKSVFTVMSETTKRIKYDARLARANWYADLTYASPDNIQPFYMKNGDVIYVSSTDGATMKPSSLAAYDEDMNYMNIWTLNIAANRTITVANLPSDCHYVRTTTDSSGTDGEVVVYNKSSIYNFEGQIVNYFETSTTATRTYYKNDIFAVNGVLRKATSTISSGSAITNSNAPATSLGGEITLLNNFLDYGSALKYEHTSKTSYTFGNCYNTSGNYGAFLFFGATGASANFFIQGFINATATPVVTLFTIANNSGRTFSATYSPNSGELTITASDTVWGGIRLIWMR